MEDEVAGGIERGGSADLRGLLSSDGDVGGEDALALQGDGLGVQVSRGAHVAVQTAGEFGRQVFHGDGVLARGLSGWHGERLPTWPLGARWRATGLGVVTFLALILRKTGQFR